MGNIKLFISFLAIAFFMESCSTDEIIYPEANIEVAKKYISLDELKYNPIELSNENGTYVLKIVSEKKWKVTSSDEWCTLSTREGFKYVEVPINFSDNPWNVNRTAHLTFTVSDTQETFVLDVTQIAAETRLNVDKEELSYGVGGGEQSVTLSTNADNWTVKVVDSDGSSVDWCTVDTEHGRGNADIKFNVTGNSTGNIRNAIIMFTAEDKVLQLPLSQLETFDAPDVELDDAVSFNLDWNEIAGISKYELKITDGNNSEIEGVENVILEPNVTTYNLSNINWGNYVGKVRISLCATMQINGTPITKESEILETHNYFDINSGDGTESAPYIISKPRHLINIGHCLDRTNVHFKQNSDIDLAGIDFVPISNNLENNEYKGEFKGVYDAGKGSILDDETKRTSEKYKISNLTINKKDKSSCGLFANIAVEGIVRNLCIDNPLIEGFAKVGGIAGESAGKIINCETLSSSENSKIYAKGDANAYLGGIIGNMSGGEVSYCINRCSIKGESGSVGGVIGNVNIQVSNTSKVLHCSNFASVNSDIKSPIGGVVGNVAGTGSGVTFNIEYCYNKGDVSGNNANNQVGGILGRVLFKSLINACQNDGSVTANGSAGGVVGRFGGVGSEIKNSINTGAILSTGGATNGNSNAGGIIATAQASGINLQNCINVGTVSASKDIYFNGIFNRSDKTANNIKMSCCYALDKDNVRQSNISDGNINDIQASSYININDAAAATISTFNGWDFANVWELVNGMYPTIKGLSK